MIEIFLVLLTTLVFVIGYKWNKHAVRSRKLNWLTSVPGLPILGNALEFGPNTETINDINRLIKKHGKLLKLLALREPAILAADYDFFEFVLGTNQILNKSSDYGFLHSWLGTGLLTSEGPKWKIRRRILTPAFHFSILERFIDSFESTGYTLIEKLQMAPNKDSIDVYHYANLYTLDVVCEAAMGVKINALTNENSEYVDDVKEESRIITDRALSITKKDDWLYFFAKDHFTELKTVKKLHHVTYSVIDARKKELEESGINSDLDALGRKKKLAFLDLLLNSTVDGKPLSRDDIREEVDTFMFEGHDTTASAVTFTLYLLAYHPEVQKMVMEEQKAIFDDDFERSSTYGDLNQMKYLEMVIKESLRLYPPVPMFGRMTNEDVEYKGNIIPKGTSITIFCYGILRDPEYYPDPATFDPSRFERADGTRPYSYIPFSAGPRNCIGQKFAMLELKSCLSKVIRNFELHPPVPDHKPILAAELTLKSKNGVRLKIVRRKL